MKLRSLTVLALVLAFLTLAATPALAEEARRGWLAGSGAFEPNTKYDTAAFMWQAPNDKVDPETGQMVDRVYFNGIVIYAYFPIYTDAQVDGGTFNAGSYQRAGAVLGYWRDCNKDGYVGARNVPAQYGSWSAYPRNLVAPDTTICPAGSIWNPDNTQFVDEFRWIGPAAAPTQQEIDAEKPCKLPTTSVANIQQGCLKPTKDRQDVSSPAGVWADFGVPDGFGATRTALQSRGWMTSSATTVERLDYFANFPLSNGVVIGERKAQGVTLVEERKIESAEARQAYAASQNEGNVGACTGSDRTLGSGPTSTCGAYPLYQVRRLVNDSEDQDSQPEPIVRVFDTSTDNDGSGSACDDQQTNAAGSSRKYADPSPGVHANPATEGSVGGTFVNVATATGNFQFDGKCTPSAVWPQVEQDRPGCTNGAKCGADWRLSFFPDQRMQTLKEQGYGNAPFDVMNVRGGPSGMWDTPYAGIGGGPRWLAGLPYAGRVPSNARSFQASFYADVGDAATSLDGVSPATALPKGVQNGHKYGQEQCPGGYDDTPASRLPNANGWICSTQRWQEYSDELGPDTRNAFVLIGAAYDLRDVDCYDGSTRDRANKVLVHSPASLLGECDQYV